jgi:hypothetical protein
MKIFILRILDTTKEDQGRTQILGGATGATDLLRGDTILER